MKRKLDIVSDGPSKQRKSAQVSSHDDTSTSPQLNVTDNMAQQTFPLFLELPRELQIQIWEYAIKCSVKRMEISHLSSLNGNARAYRIFTGPYSFKQLRWGIVFIQPRDLRSFSTIMDTCRFTRLLCLEYWH